VSKKKTGFGKLKIIILLGVLIYAGITFVNQQSIMATQLERQESLAQTEEELQREIDFKRNELNYIGTDEYIEQQARIRLGWLKPDEIKYVENENGDVVPTEQPEQPASQDQDNPDTQESADAENNAETPPSTEAPAETTAPE